MGHMGPHIIAVQPPNSDMYSRKWRITMIHFRDSNQESQVIKHPGEDVLLYHCNGEANHTHKLSKSVALLFQIDYLMVHFGTGRNQDSF